MFNLAEYRKKPKMLADFLPWAALVAPGVVLNKDGSFQRTAQFRGPDLDSATPAELVGTTARLNNALRRLGSGWAIFVEASRIAAQRYPQSRFPDPVSNLVDAERRAQFEEAGAHFESAYYLTFLWLPPSEEASRAERWLYEGRSRETAVDAHELLNGFIDRTDRVLQLVEGFVPESAWLSDSETLTYLHSTISTRRHRVRVPDTPMHLDALLADEPLTCGLEPRLGNAHLRILTIIGFPTATFPGILDELNRLAFPYRWSTRAICLDKTEATRLLVQDPPAMVRQAKVDHGDPQGGNDQRIFRAPRQRCPQQSLGRRCSAPGARLRRGIIGLFDRDCYGLGRGASNRRREAAAWSKRSSRAATSPASRRRSTRSKLGSGAFPAMSTPMSANHQSRPSTSLT